MDAVRKVWQPNSMNRRGKTIGRIEAAVKKIGERFRAADVNAALGIDWAGTFLPKHREGNPGGYTVFFVRISPGLYRLCR